MSGDFGPRITIPAVLQIARAESRVNFSLVGNLPVLQQWLAENHQTLPANVELQPSTSVIAMDENPRRALRQTGDSSLAVALSRLGENDADACISAGNSGALVLLAKRYVGCVEGVDLPAFCKAMPVETGATLMLDLGANLYCDADKLVQFATMGQVLARASGVATPRVALLNIGAEEGKGTENIRTAAERLSAWADIHYVGFIEADEIYAGQVDVIVCDGFTGNIALKTSEGVARLIARKIERSLQQGLWRLPALLLWPLVRQWRRDLNPDAYNGAVLVGLNKVVIKSHGGASVEAFANAVALALAQVREGVPDKIARSLAAAE